MYFSPLTLLPESLISLPTYDVTAFDAFEFDDDYLLFCPFEPAYKPLPGSAVHVQAQSDRMTTSTVPLVNASGSPSPSTSAGGGGSVESKIQLPRLDSGTVLVHPPTPTREFPESPQSIISLPAVPSVPTVRPRISPRASPRTSPSASPRTSSRVLPTSTLGIDVLPEVRSPPRRASSGLGLAGTTDALQLAGGRRSSRRPRMFGFTELMDVPNSASSSPELPSSPVDSPTSSTPTQPFFHAHHVAHAPSPGSVLPRRNPTRTRSETSLPSLHTLPSPRRRENGLKLNLQGIITNTPSSNSVSAPSSATASATIRSPYNNGLIRKKSGEIVKPALKQIGPLLPNGTPVVKEKSMYESRSCPTTPSCPKYVHFDTKLEHVKLFLQDQKPLVVSRDGSPTLSATTSDGEEFPFPPTDEEKEGKKILQIRLPNFPPTLPLDSDLFLESLYLDDDRKSLRGIVQVRNIAFEKWVAVRFTFDWWQTTSEVTATYKESVKGGSHDRFTFHLKLHDLLDRIEEKTLFICIRFNTEGREIWDSNGGQNYQVLFERRVQEEVRYMPKRSASGIAASMGKSSWSVAGGDRDRMADLRAKLNQLSEDDHDLNPPLSPSKRASSSNGNFGSSSPRGSPARALAGVGAVNTIDPPALPVAGSRLSARYDFGSALKTSRRLSPNRPILDLPDVQTGLLYPPGTTSTTASTASGPGSTPGGRVNHGHAATEFYSPRSDKFVLPTVGAAAITLSGNGNDTIFSQRISSPQPSSPLALEVLPDDVLPDASPSIASASTSTTSDTPSPVLDAASTASDTTPSDSPMSPPDVSLPRWSPSTKGDDMSLANYSSFIEQFCWGGAPTPTPPTPRAAHPLEGRRIHSTSSLDYFHDAREFNPALSSGVNVSAGGSMTPRASSFTPLPAIPDHLHSHHGHHSHSQSLSLSRSSSASSNSSSMYYTPYSSTPQLGGGVGGGNSGAGTNTPPLSLSRDELDIQVDNVYRSLSSSLASTPVEGSPVLTPVASVPSPSPAVLC